MIMDAYMDHIFGLDGNRKEEKNKKPDIPGLPPVLQDILDNITKDLHSNYDSEIFDVNNVPDNLPEPVRQIFDKLKNLKERADDSDLESDEINEMIDSEMNKIFGEPENNEIYEEDGITIHRMTWNVGEGAFTRYNKMDNRQKLEMELKAALDVENFEKAAEIRDELKKIKSLKK